MRLRNVRDEEVGVKKRCLKCDEVKPLAEFLDPVLPADHLSKVCDDCRNERVVDLNREEES